MNKATKILLTAALAITTAGAGMAQGASHICAYVNDNVYGPNAVEGYKIGPGTATAHVGPYSTNGQGYPGEFNSGGLAATRVLEGDLYVNDEASKNITHFTVNKTDCTLTLDPTLYPSGDRDVAYGDTLAVTPDGRTMFVGSTGDFHIYSHTIAAAGALGRTFTETLTNDYPAGFEVSPDGRTLVVSYFYLSEVCAYPISGGHLGKPNCQSLVYDPEGVSIDPSGACVYAALSSLGTSGVAAFTLTGSVLGIPTVYKPFGPGENSTDVVVNWNNEAIYISDAESAQVISGSIASGCNLTYKAIIADGIPNSDFPGQIAQGKISHAYVVTGDAVGGTPSMGIFEEHANGNLTPLGSGQFPLMSGSVHTATVVVVGVE